ncbi:hypothetical protein CXB51_011785 [Gossypium anomalum]|uniref:Aminotransferase-like plant mobile domain-containing protein n=1 Tax=Gossypium anomalum TaxID=47600 RepID=A0A8J6D3F0_9ROSI|nr:hypothetical protein CXB51_011785 [Gossypium anomalum]
MSGPSSSLIENYLREAGFWHAATIGSGCKLDPKLISSLIERWRLDMYTFHLPFEKCTITLEDVYLQLGLLVDGVALTGSVQSADWGAIYYDLLGTISDNIYEGRIEIGWLRDIFPELGNNSTELERIRYVRAYILKIIGAGELSWGFVVLATCIGRRAGRRHQIKQKLEVAYHYYNHGLGFAFPFYVIEWNHPGSYVGIPTALEDIRLLLDQQLEAYTKRIECCNNLDSDNRFLRNLKCSMTSTKSTYDKRIRIGRYSGRNISKFRKTSHHRWRIVRGTVEELISLPFPIALWDSNTSDVGDANTSTFFILPKWVILSTPITEATTTLAEQLRRNPARNHRPPPYGTDFDRHIH